MFLLKRVSWPVWIVVLAVVVLVALAACSDDDIDVPELTEEPTEATEAPPTPTEAAPTEEPTSPEATATPTATLAPTEGATPTDTLAPQAERPTAAQEVQGEVVTPTGGVIEVSTMDLFFEKNHFQVGLGEAVTFDVTNDGQVPHTFTVAGIDGQFGTDDDITTEFLSGGDNEALDVTLSVPGTYVFRCNLHPQIMWGEIDVQAGGSSAGSGAGSAD